MALTQIQIALQMVAQLRALDPSISAEVGTPERKILDTVAEAITDAQIDLNLLSGSLDITSKYGTDLDNYVGLFGFGRQTGSFSTGFVTFSRATAAPYNIVVPGGTQVQGSASANGASVLGATVTFQTTQAVTLATGQTSVTAPIQAVIAGSSGNVAAGAIIQFANVGSPVLGVTGVTNGIPTTNGTDQESDPELKVRFQNTVFRNMAGTSDQYMALAVSTQFSTKATILGPISRYQEYIQVPALDDSTRGGIAGEWTTAPSNNPYAKAIYIDTPFYVSTGGTTGFLRENVDCRLNAPPLLVGDSQGDTPTATQPNVSFLQVLPGVTDATVVGSRPGDILLFEYAYISAESRNDVGRNITNCVDVYVNGSNPITADAVLPPLAGGHLFSATSTDTFYTGNFRRIGEPDTTPVPNNYYTSLYWQPVISLPTTIVVGAATYLQDIHYFAVEDKTLIGNTIRARNGIEWNPTLNGLAGTDTAVSVWASGSTYNTIGTIVYYGTTFYQSLAVITNDAVAPPSDSGNWSTHGVPFTGATILANLASSITVTGYGYDKNIVDLQSALEGSKQITTDVLAHRAVTRYFKLDVTIVYRTGQTQAAVNAQIASNVQSFLTNQAFGATIQLTDLLFVIRGTNGVLNARWSHDDNPMVDNCVVECDVNGTLLSGPVVFNVDFYLRDNALPSLPLGTVAGDSVAGMIIRPRAQNTFAMP